MINRFYRDGVFESKHDAESRVIPEYITGIDAESFTNRDDLISLELHENIDYIGDFSFKLCYNLRELTLPDRVDYFGTGVFQQCNKLKYIKLPEGTKKIDSGMFVCCESLTRLEIPASVESIDPYAFSTCRELREVKVAPEVFGLLPVSMKKIAALTYFNECTGCVDEGIGSFTRENSFEIAKYAIDSNMYQAIEYLVQNDLIMNRDVPGLLNEADRHGNTELSAMIIGAGRKSGVASDMFDWDPFA